MTNKPLVSIIVPSLRQSQITQCLASIERYTTGINYETILISPFDIGHHPNTVHIKESKPEGVYKAIAKGYEQAKGEYITGLTDDARATPNWLTNMVTFMMHHDNEIFEGNYRHFDIRGERPEPGIYGKLYAPFLCIRRDKADRIGGLFDNNYMCSWADIDLSFRVWYNNGKVETCPNAWIYHVDYHDNIRKIAHDAHFDHDRDTFIQMWHHIYSPSDKNFYGSRPVRNGLITSDLPPKIDDSLIYVK